MAGLKFTFEADVNKIRQTRQEIEKLKKEMISLPEKSPLLDNLSKELQKLKKEYESLAEKMAKIQLAFRNAMKAEEMAEELKKVTQRTEESTNSFVKHADSLEELGRQSKLLTKEWLSMSEAQRKSESGQGVASQIASLNGLRKLEADGLRALQKEYVNTQKVQVQQEGSITSLRAQLSRLTVSYDALGRAERNGAYGKELLGSIQTVTKELSDAEQASMRFQRSVGNYASGWNGLSVQVQQVARELPSLAVGANTFFLAISNNLPMLADEIAKAKKEYKALIVEGKSATPVWKQLISSLVSWQTALVAVVTILSLYGKEIVSWVGSLFTAKKALSETFQSLEDYQKKVGDTSGSIIATLEKLSEGWKQLGGNLDAQKKYIQENKDAIASLGVSITDAAEAERIFSSNKDTFILSIMERAKAAAAMDLAAEQYKKAIQKMMEVDTMPDKSSQFIQTSSFGTGYYIETDNLKKKRAQKEADDLFNEGAELIKKYAQFSEEERKALESIGIKTTETMIDGSVEAIEATIALKQQSLKKVTDPKEYKRIEAEIKAEQTKLKAITGEKEKLQPYVDTYNQDQEVEKSAQAIKDIVRKTELDIRQQGIDLLEEGSEKQLEQIRLNYDKRKDEIEKQERELLQKLQEEERKQWEQDNPDYRKKNLQFTSTITSLTPEQKKQFDEEYSLALQKQEKDAQSLLNKLLEKYRDYDAQRTAIEEQGNKDIAALQTQRTDANAEEIDRAIQIAQDKIKEGIQKINDTEASAASKDNDFFKLLYGDVSSMSFGTLQNLISQAKQLREYLSGKGDTKGITFISPDQLKAIEKSPAELDKLKKALDKLLDSPKDGSGNKWENIFNSFKKGFAELKGAKGFKEISGAIGTITGAASSAAGELSNMFEEMGKTEIADAIGGVQQVMSAVSNIGEGFAKGGPIGGIAAAIGEAANFIGQAFAASARHKAALKEIMTEAIAQQREYNLLLLEQNLLYEKATTIFGVDSYSKAKNAVDNLKESIEDLNDELSGTPDQQKKQSKDSLFKKFFGVSDPQAELKKAYAGLANIEIKTGHKKTGLFGWGKGKDIYSSILDVYPQLIDANDKFDKSLAETIINTREISDESKSALQNMIDLAEQAENAYEELNNYLTDIFGDLGDSMTDALVDSFANGKDAAKAFADSVSDMLENLAKQMVYSVTLAPLMEKAQKEMLDTMQNTGLTDEQKFNKWTETLNNLVNDAVSQQSLANKLLEEYQQTAADKGFDIFKPESSSQEASRGTFQTMSQDTGAELNGRFTALQMAGEEIKDQAIKQTDLLSSIYDKMSILDVESSSPLALLAGANTPDIAGQTREIITNSYQSPVNIVFPTDEIKVLTDKLSNMERIVDEMRTVQVNGLLESQTVAENTTILAKNSPRVLSGVDEIKRDVKGAL